MNEPPIKSTQQDPEDPDKLKQALKDAGIKTLEYTPYQHPRFAEQLGFKDKEPTEPSKVSVLVLEPEKSPVSEIDAERHGEYAAAITNAVADHLSGRNIEVIMADDYPEILGFESNEEFNTNVGKMPSERPPLKSNLPENIAHKREVFASTDVVSVSYTTNDPDLAFGGEHTKIAKDAWQGIDTVIALSAGNEGDESEIPHEYRTHENFRVLPQDMSSISQFAHYSFSVGAVTKDAQGEYVLTKYSSFNDPTFLAAPPDKNTEGMNVKYKFYDASKIDAVIKESAEMGISPNEQDAIVSRIKGPAKNEYDSIDNISYIPGILDRSANEIHALQIDGKKEDVAVIRKRHADNLETYMLAEIRKELHESYEKEKSSGFTDLPRELPSDDQLKSAVKNIIEKGSMDGAKLDVWSENKLDVHLPFIVGKYITPSIDSAEDIPATVGSEIRKAQLDQKLVESRKEFDKRIDAEGYSSNLRGTSFSAPVVAGQIAALKELHPKATNDDILWAMASTAKPVYTIEGIKDMVLSYHESASGLRYNDTHAGFGMTDFKAANDLLGKMNMPPAKTKEVVAESTRMIDNREEGREYTVNVPDGINTTKATVELQFSSHKDTSFDDKDGKGEVVLVSPKGDQILLNYTMHDRYAVASTNAFLNTQGEGTWRIRIPAAESLDNVRITLQGLEPDDVRMNRRPPEREPLREINNTSRMTQMYEQSYTVTPEAEDKKKEEPKETPPEKPGEIKEEMPGEIKKTTLKSGMEQAIQQVDKQNLRNIPGITRSASDATNLSLPGRPANTQIQH